MNSVLSPCFSGIVTLHSVLDCAVLPVAPHAGTVLNSNRFFAEVVSELQEAVLERQEACMELSLYHDQKDNHHKDPMGDHIHSYAHGIWQTYHIRRKTG